MRRRLVAIAAIAAVAMPSIAIAEPSEAAKLNAYGFAVRCFAANGASVGDKRYNPNGKNDAVLREKAYSAYHTAQVMGGQLGYTKERIAEDLMKAANVESSLMLRDDGYFQRMRADCSKLGML